VQSACRNGVELLERFLDVFERFLQLRRERLGFPSLGGHL
jgi:hypothetical protein